MWVLGVKVVPKCVVGIAVPTSRVVRTGRYICWSFVCFSSRRRHTRFDCVWSSDVCSSDLYAATRGDALVRTDLCAEAIRLARLVRALMAPPPPEATALLALMLLHDSRRDARLDDAGELVLLEAQDRRRWNRDQIAEALPLVEEALRGGPGTFGLQAAIAALHCQATRAEDTDWPQIVRLYDVLERLQPSPIVSLNRAAAVAMVDGPRPALALIDALGGDLDRYHLLHAARADLLRRLGSSEEAAKSYARALALVPNDAERRFLARRLREVQRSDRP